VPADAFFAFYALLLGLIVGSYLNVAIHRIPRGVSTVLPRSRCPHCGEAIRTRDNLPLVSYLLLRGRCRACRAAIPWRYPLVEALTAVLFVGLVLRFGLSQEALAFALFISLLITLAGIDREHYVLPDRLTLPGLLAGLALQPWISQVSLRSALTGAAVGGLSLLAVATLWVIVRREEGMGLGDAKMLAMIGAFLGLQGMLVALFVAFFAGAAAGLTLVALSHGQLKTRLPFGVFLALGAVVSVFWGPFLAERYLALL
jgi:leader peptidase (prepilin peptidase)/N-methyltransferase